VIKIKVDIIGGSFGGLSSAISLKENDKSIDVIVHEKYKKIGYNPEGRRCGEAHSIEKDWDKWIPKGKSIFNEILRGEIEIGKKKYFYERKPKTAFMLNRQEFICQLVRDAEKLGVKIRPNNKVKSFKDLDGDYIIDASGCPSAIKRELNLNKGFKGVTYQQTIENCNIFKPNTVEIKFLGTFGYIWIFPRDPEKKEINLGIGYSADFGYNLKNVLENFKKEREITGKINYVCGGLIPLGLQRPFAYKNILFVGDAGVGAYMLNGQGIYRALISGDIAGRCIAGGYVKKYSSIINKEFMRWDLLGKNFTRINKIFRKINPSIVIKSLEIFTKLTKTTH